MKKTIGNFTVQKKEEISEIKSHLFELKHEPTQASVIYLGCDDDENVFNISFRTFPESSNGAAHVLEHIVLCGSEKFPVKDPFFAMSRRSMNTFMNALTGSDFTCYPAASQIETDFYNLLEVYLDAVFHPRLLKESFWQEGIHFELSEKNAPLRLKGIVYNEMKGALATAETRIQEDLFAALFPDLPYRFNSGGNPANIRTLSLEDIKAFHKAYYHPSRALFYFYGNLPLEKHLDFLEKNALKNVKPLPPLPLVSKQKRFKERVYKIGKYPTEADGSLEKTYVSLAFLTTSILDQEELLALNVIELALFGTDAAPLKRAILESKLCKTVDLSVEDEISEIPIVITCKGCKEDVGNQIETVVRNTLTALAETGIEAHLIEGALHQLEFARKEIAGNSFPYGLSLFFRSGLLKQHGGDPTDGLKVHSLFQKLRKRCEDPHYIPSLLKKYFLDNTHFVHMITHPDPTLSEKEREEENAFIKNREEKLTNADRNALMRSEKELLAYQEDEGNVEILPRLSLTDVPKEGKDFPLKIEKEGNLDLYQHNCFTNDILYSALFFDLPDRPFEDFAFLRLFTLLIAELGCGGRNYKQNLDYIFQHVGEVGCDLDLFISSDDPLVVKPSFSFKGKALHRNMENLLTLFYEMLDSVDFRDKERIGELLKQHREGLENSLQKSPLRYAVNLATSGFSPACHLQYLWYGLDYVEKVKKITDAFEKNPHFFIDKMESLKETLFGIEGGKLVLSTPDTLYKEAKKANFWGLSGPMTKSFTPINMEKIPSYASPESQGRIISSPVNFTALAFPSFAYNHPFAATLSVAAELMESKVLHRRIREQGGAYGGGASHSASWGYFYFYAYRDPHLKSTLEAFKEGVEAMISGRFDERELEEAKLSVLQGLDTPNPPESRALIAYAWQVTGRSKRKRQVFRDRLFALTKQDIKQVAEEFLLPGVTKKGTLVTFGGKEGLTRENLALKEKALPLYPVP